MENIIPQFWRLIIKEEKEENDGKSVKNEKMWQKIGVIVGEKDEKGKEKKNREDLEEGNIRVTCNAVIKFLLCLVKYRKKIGQKITEITKNKLRLIFIVQAAGKSKNSVLNWNSVQICVYMRVNKISDYDLFKIIVA